jgi:chromosome segregation ATPase
MVTIMTLLIVCAVFAILGGLAFTEVRAMQFKLQEKQRQYDEAITALDVYRARVEDNRRRAEMYVGLYEKAQGDWNTVNQLYSKHRNNSAVLLTQYELLQMNHNSLKSLYGKTFDEVKVLRSLFNEHEQLKQKHDELVAKHQSIIDTLPDWAGGEVIDDEDKD